MKTVLVLCVFLAACVPARLERLADRGSRAGIVSSDLARAFGGASDEAATRSLGKWIERNHSSSSPESPPGFRVTWHPGGPGIIAPRYFDRLEPAASYQVRGLTHQRTIGIGVPLVGIREHRSLDPVEKWYPPQAITRAVTAVAIPMSPGSVEIRLIDRMRTETLTVRGTRQPLAADFTVPFATLLERTGLPLTPGTAAHIITGSMDFVVQRSSATVADAESNIEVPAGHGSFHHPQAIAEIVRILELPACR